MGRELGKVGSWNSADGPRAPQSDAGGSQGCCASLEVG